MVEKMFLQLLNMNFTASFVIIFVLIARLLLKKSPKVLSYALWGAVLFRLVHPFSFESMFSLLPVKSNPIPLNIVYEAIPTIDTGIPAINHTVNQSLPAATTAASINPLQIWTFIGSAVWLMGMAILVIYSVFTLIKLQKRLKNAVHEKDNIYLAEHLDTPFVMGIIRPKIYLPATLTDEEKRYIIIHEQMHIRRFDHVVKLVSFFVLCLHWFNPLVWVAFFISGKDMEMSCDEAVIKELGNNVKKKYSSSLLTLATGSRIIGGSPLAFGEGDTRGRIKNVLNYKKPAFWIVITSFLITVVLGFGLAANQKTNRSFKMSGSHVSDLQPGEIVRNIAEIIKPDTNDIKIPPDNFGLTVSSDFSWVKDEAIHILYVKNEKSWNTSQLRIFIGDSEFFVTAPSNWITYDGPVFSLQAYLEALKYLPQKEIASLCKESPQRYAIELSENDRKLNADRCLYYNKDGITENNDRHIRLDIQPLYGDNESSFTGVGTDIIHVFYSGNNSIGVILNSAEELWNARTKYVGDNSAVGKLIGLLPVPEGLHYDHFKLHTSLQPYSIEIVYSVPTEELKKYDTENIPVANVFRKNTLLLLALVDNAEGVRAVLTDGKREVRFANDREWADYTMGGDVRNYAENPEKLLELINLYNSNPMVEPLTQDQAVVKALSTTSNHYLGGECFGEGHIILGMEEDGNVTKLYTLTMAGHYGFQNDNFVKVSGTGVIPAVVTLSSNNDVSIAYPKDGSYYVSSIKEMFPSKYHNRIFDDRESDRETLKIQEQVYAKEYLSKIGRKAEIGDFGDFEHTLLTDLGISVEVSNKIMEGFHMKQGNYPYFIGTQEYIEDNLRMVYEMNYHEAPKEIRFRKYTYETKEIVAQFVFDSLTGEQISQ